MVDQQHKKDREELVHHLQHYASTYALPYDASHHLDMLLQDLLLQDLHEQGEEAELEE